MGHASPIPHGPGGKGTWYRPCFLPPPLLPFLPAWHWPCQEKSRKLWGSTEMGLAAEGEIEAVQTLSHTCYMERDSKTASTLFKNQPSADKNIYHCSCDSTSGPNSENWAFIPSRVMWVSCPPWQRRVPTSARTSKDDGQPWWSRVGRLPLLLAEHVGERAVVPSLVNLLCDPPRPLQWARISSSLVAVSGDRDGDPPGALQTRRSPLSSSGP